MDGTETKHVGDLAYCILVFTDQFLALLQFDIEQIILRRSVQMCLEQRLKRRTGYVEFVADFFYSDRLGNPLIHIRKDFGKQVVSGELTVA